MRICNRHLLWWREVSSYLWRHRKTSWSTQSGYLTRSKASKEHIMLWFLSKEKNFNQEQKEDKRNDRWQCTDSSDICKFQKSVIIIIIISIGVFHISVSWWSFTGVWVTARLLKSPGLFSVFLLFSIMLFGWSQLVRQLPSPPVPLIIL